MFCVAQRICTSQDFMNVQSLKGDMKTRIRDALSPYLHRGWLVWQLNIRSHSGSDDHRPAVFERFLYVHILRFW
jgi:hypothetical protein